MPLRQVFVNFGKAQFSLALVIAGKKISANIALAELFD